jgi:crotonobetaine/carnitine-CoA ligase
MTDRDAVLPRALVARAEASPEAIFLHEIGGEEVSFAAARERVERWAGALRSLGVEAGAHVAAMLPNGSAAAEVWLATNWLGAVEVPIHVEYRGRILSHLLDVSAARVLVVHRQLLPQIAEIAAGLESLRSVVVVGGSAGEPQLHKEIHAADALLAASAPVEESAPVHESDICTVLFTSGTTGVSKGVMIPYAQLAATTEGCWPMDEMSADDVYYCMLPGYHISGKIALQSMLWCGGRLVLRDRFKTDAFWEDVRATGATCACVMGAMAGFLMARPESPDDAETTMDKVLMLPLSPELDRFRERFGLRVHTIFNQTEISCPICNDRWDTGDGVSCGRVRPGYECRVVDEHDVEVEPGTVGELVVRADRPWTHMAGYLGMPEKTVETTRNQWLHTGDAFTVDEDGNYYFVDRIKDVIRRRGENISSVEVEDAIASHAEVLECAAVPVASEWTEEEVKVIVVRTAGSDLDAAALVEFVEPLLPRFMVPRYVEFAEALPKTPTQKVRKAELRELGITTATWDRNA